jgi:hypothetical protein
MDGTGGRNGDGNEPGSTSHCPTNILLTIFYLDRRSKGLYLKHSQGIAKRCLNEVSPCGTGTSPRCQHDHKETPGTSPETLNKKTQYDQGGIATLALVHTDTYSRE